MKSVFLQILVMLSTARCSTWKKETLAYMGGALVAGAVNGAAQAPEGEDKSMHGLLWGAVAAAATGATIVYTTDENDQIRERDLKIRVLQDQLSNNKLMIDEGHSQFLNKELPESLQGLVQPGSWQLFETDKWKQVKKGSFIHQDMVLEVKPAKLRVKQ